MWMTASLWYPSVDDVLAIHEDIVSEYPETSQGVRSRNDIEFALDYIEGGTVGNPPRVSGVFEEYAVLTTKNQLIGIPVTPSTV
jgi:hypothetical protein